MLPLMKDGEWAVCQQRSTGSEGCWCKHSAACLKELKEKSHQGLVVLLAIGWVWSGYLSWKIILKNSVEGRKGRTSKKKKFKTSISYTLQTWWLLLLCAGAAQTHGCCQEAELHPHFSEFPLSWTRSWWKSIFTLLLLQAWKKWNGHNMCEGAPKV